MTGQLLIAVPRPDDQVDEDDVFARSVILVLHHDDEGAHGLVLNRPLRADVDVVLPGWRNHVTAPQTLFQGGPVQLDSALALAAVPGDDSSLGIKRLFGAVGLVDLDAPPVVVMPEVNALRIFAGYSGWGSDQLEGEIRRGMWFVVEAEAADAFTHDPDGLWAGVLRRQHSSLALVSTFPADPSMN
nr:YqgE/AlgH family protein [Demetria terragena]